MKKLDFALKVSYLARRLPAGGGRGVPGGKPARIPRVPSLIVRSQSPKSAWQRGECGHEPAYNVRWVGRLVTLYLGCCMQLGWPVRAR